LENGLREETNTIGGILRPSRANIFFESNRLRATGRIASPPHEVLSLSPHSLDRSDEPQTVGGTRLFFAVAPKFLPALPSASGSSQNNASVPISAMGLNTEREIFFDRRSQTPSEVTFHASRANVRKRTHMTR
jgi:hypothetical protein